MSEADDTTPETTPRRRGRPLRIDRSRIIQVAKTFDPGTVTMQAVADELGVARKALSYHVPTRDALLRLVAADVFEEHFAISFEEALAGQRAGTTLEWQEAVRLWAVTVRDSFVATGSPTNYFRITGDSPAVFEPVEFVLQRMLDAGFDLPTASRALVFLTRLAMGVGRDVVMENQLGEHPQGAEVRRVLNDDVDESRFGALRWLMSSDMNGPADIGAQFDFEMEVFLDGMKRRLPAAD